MEKIELTIDGYKCYNSKREFNLNNITLLTGANSAGKSSVIQSLLLGRILSETIVEDSNNNLVPISLMNDKYALELGRYDDIYNREGAGNINFSFDGIQYSVIAEENENEEAKDVVFSISSDNKASLKAVFSSGFTYLCADRKAPHYEYKESDSKDVCDCHGGNMGDVYSKHSNDKAIESRYRIYKEDTKLQMQLDDWCDYIFPGVDIRVEKTGTQMYKLKIRNDVAPNVGFGITYALPILLSGLITPAGGMLIVENPEAHLHAKAQSNMGYFLARMAAAGVRVIIETHSEHIVNGIRRMIVEGTTDMSHEDMTIYFFQNKDGMKNILEIGMDEKGNLSDFPVDFFDQVRQDTLSILQIDRQKHK